MTTLGTGFHSIGVPSEWGHDWAGRATCAASCCFHSIGVPSEWGQISATCVEVRLNMVSIQLVSPASGDVGGYYRQKLVVTGFPFNWCPQRVGTYSLPNNQGWLAGGCFHSIGVPSEWGLQPKFVWAHEAINVSIQLVSPASGD